MNFEVRLTEVQMLMAAQAGIAKRIRSFRDGLNPYVHCSKSDWATDIDGACAEMAVAKFLDVFYDGSINSFKLPDVAGLQVRSTTNLVGKLIIRPNDVPRASDFFVLVICKAPLFWIRGGMFGEDAMQDMFLFDPNNGGTKDSWFVEQKCLVELLKVRHGNAAWRSA